MIDQYLKETVNYRFPEKCCMTCKNSTFDHLLEPMCLRLDRRVDNHVDKGAICDLYEDPEVQ